MTNQQIKEGNSADIACCGGPAEQNLNACCQKDVQAKAEGKSGCGCNHPASSEQTMTEAK